MIDPVTGYVPNHIRTEILAALRRYMAEAELSQGDVAKAVGSSATYVSDLLNEKSSLGAEAAAQLLKDINNWLDREARAGAAHRPEHFATTAIAQAFANVGTMVSERPTIAAAWGPSGIGKTKCCEAIAADLGAVYIRVDADSASPTKFLAALQTALSRSRRSQARPSLRLVIEKLRTPEKVKSPNVVIIDEAHRLRKKTLDLIRDVHDQARCSVLLVGTYEINLALDADDADGLGQLCSRVSIRCDLVAEAQTINPKGGDRLFTAAEVRAVLERMKLKLHPDATRMLMCIANQNRGALRVAEDVFYYAHKLALKAGATQVLAAHVEKAVRQLRKTVRVQLETDGGEARKAVSA